MAERTINAHDQKVTLHILHHYAEHPDRKHDPAYKLFHATVERTRQLGLEVCWVCGLTRETVLVQKLPPLEYHHSKIEYALQNMIDWHLFAADFPEFHIDSDDAFAEFIEGPGNLTVLCPTHHRLAQGIHSIDYPTWEAIKWAKEGLIPGKAIGANAE